MADVKPECWNELHGHYLQSTLHAVFVHWDDIINANAKSLTLVLPLMDSPAHVTFCVAADQLPAQINKLYMATDKMASVLNGESDAYIDIEGHKVRNYDLALAEIPRIDYRDPQIELMIANEVSLAQQWIEPAG